MLASVDYQGIKYFYILEKARECLYKMKFVSFEEHKNAKAMFRRLYKQRSGTNLFVKKLAQTGQLNGFFSSFEIKNALEYGKLPLGYDVHHILPLDMGGTNDESNLCLIDQTLHRYLHKKILNLAKNNYEKDIPTCLVLPKMEKVVTWKDASLFFQQDEIDLILKEEAIRAQKKAYQAQKRKMSSKKKNVFIPKKVLLDVGELNAAFRRRIRGQQKRLEEERRKQEQKTSRKQPGTYRDSDKYHRSELKTRRNVVKRVIQKHLPGDKPHQYGD